MRLTAYDAMLPCNDNAVQHTRSLNISLEHLTVFFVRPCFGGY